MASVGRGVIGNFTVLAETRSHLSDSTAVIATDDARFARVVNRGRTGDPLEREKFDRDDARARGSARDGFQQNSLLIDLAEHSLMNTGDLDELHRSIDTIMTLAERSTKKELGK